MLQQKKIFALLTDRAKRSHHFKVKRRSENACWPWTGASRADGYGIMRIAGETVYAHRVAAVIARGEDIPEGMVVDHTCRNKACCNPRHLEVITQPENVERHHRAINPTSVCRRGHNHERGKPCKECNRLNAKKWRDANQEKSKAIARRYESKRAKTRWDWHKNAIWEPNPDLIS